MAGFALLIFAVGLNLSGVFEFGSVTVGDSLAQRSGATGAFFTGVLAVAVAAPCTAPFMAAALGFALTQSVASALLIFFALGVGFALPFLILGLWPRALSFLPKPGPWMLRLKQFLAFPMYGAAAWLAWVLAQETGANGVAVLLAAFVALALAAWLWSVTRDLQVGDAGIGAAAAVAVFLVAALYGISLLPRRARTPPPSRHRQCRELHAGEAGVAARRRQAGLRGRHRRLVHHLSGQRTGRAVAPRRQGTPSTTGMSPIWWRTGPTATPPSPNCWKPMAAPACRFISITPRAPTSR